MAMIFMGVMGFYGSFRKLMVIYGNGKTISGAKHRVYNGYPMASRNGIIFNQK